MVDLVRHYDGSRPVHLRQIAEDNDLSHGYLEQLMISLRNASLVRGLSGRKGGYVLARPAEDIKLTEIVEAAIGPINVVDCVLYPENCTRAEDCESRPIWVMINEAIKGVLNRYTLAQMADAKWHAKVTKDLAPLAGDLAYPKKVMRRRGRTAAVTTALSGACGSVSGGRTTAKSGGRRRKASKA